VCHKWHIVARGRDNLIYLKKGTKKQTSRGISATPVASPPVRDLRAPILAGAARFLERHGFILAVSVLSMVICFWMITEGTGEVLAHHGFDAFYDGQADSLVHGHWDVSPEAVIGEAFVVHGKYYGYFGFTPALPRIVLNLLFPSRYGQWTRLMMLLWVFASMAAILALMGALEIPASPFLLLVAVLGSTLFFLCSHAIVYHEASITGAALALWAYLFFFRYLREQRLGFLVAACVLSFLSFFARLTVGAGPLIFAAFLCVALLYRQRAQGLLDRLNFPSPAAAGKHAAILALCLGITVATYVSVNHAKFGTWLNPAPYQYHIQYDAARLAQFQGNINHFSNIPFDAGAYFGPNRMEFQPRFPWVGMIKTWPDPGSGAKMDLIERYSSIPDAMPALGILSVLGIIFVAKGGSRRTSIPVIAAAFAAGCLILTNAYISYRYLHDFYPFLIVAAILGLGAISSIPSKPLRLRLKVLIAIAGIWSIAANFAFSLKWQREDFWPDPAARAAFRHVSGRIDSLLLSGHFKSKPIKYKIGDDLEYLRTGQLLTVVDPPATYRYDGLRWNYVSGIPLHIFRLKIKFPLEQSGTHMPLWFAGNLGSSDALYVVYSTPTRVEFCFDHWRNGGPCGTPMDILTGAEYHVRIDADRLNSALTVTLDGRKVVEAPVSFYLWKDQDVLLGKSLAPEAHGRDFSGEIKLDQEAR
jgi:hypothetical protein